jgi:prepilin-type N-terminal cleavage/methylation domain-containing protein
MQTSVARISEASENHPFGLQARQTARAGFTLLEITLVVLIISVLLAITIPRLRDTGRTKLESHARRLAAVFRVLRTEAVLTGTPYRLNYDLDLQRYWVSADGGDADSGFVHEYQELARGTTFEPPVGMIDIVLPTLAGKIAQGQIYTVFYPDGGIDPTVIHLGTEHDMTTLYVDPIRSRLRVEPGYLDVDY